MKLIFRSPYLSINALDPVELPNFTVITGVNGSGKSHLLEAIEKRHIEVDGVQASRTVLFNYETFRLENEAAFNAQQLSAERDQAWQVYESTVRKPASTWIDSLGSAYPEIKKLCEDDGLSLWEAEHGAIQKYREYVDRYFSGPQLRGNQHAAGIHALARTLPYALADLTKSDFDSAYKPYALRKDFLPAHLGKVFWDYYVRFFQNQVNQYQRDVNGKPYSALTEPEFERKHGRRPWLVVNEILAGFDSLKYRVSSPEGTDVFRSFQLKLQHTELPNLQIEFSSLSSGERVLMALVASVYKASADRDFPDLLLLDEVDASLHPSMMRNMLDVIDRIFLKHRVKVILITHSPTTIALAPESAIHVMNRTGPSRLVKKSKSDALAILTEGFATIEQGLRLFDQVARSKLTIVTEGHNASILEKLLELHKMDGVQVLGGVENVSGDSQLRTIFQFLSRTQHSGKVLVVWDCDFKSSLQAQNNTFPFTIPSNPENSLARTGIENAFPEFLLESFIKTITFSNNKVIREFDDTQKKAFAAFIVSRANIDDFKYFSSLIEEINRINSL